MAFRSFTRLRSGGRHYTSFFVGKKNKNLVQDSQRGHSNEQRDFPFWDWFSLTLQARHEMFQPAQSSHQNSEVFSKDKAAKKTQ